VQCIIRILLNFFAVYRVFLIISIIIALCLLVFYFYINGIYTKLHASELVVLKHLFIIVSVFSVVTFPFTTFNGVLMANEQFIVVKVCNLAQKVLHVLLIVVFLMAGYGVYALVLINAFTNVLFLLVKFLYIRKKMKSKAVFSKMDKPLVKQIVSFSGWITVMELAQRCIFNIMPSVIAALVGATSVTIFSVAAILESYVFMFADAINGMFMPRIARIFSGTKAEGELSVLMNKVGKFHVITLGLLFI